MDTRVTKGVTVYPSVVEGKRSAIVRCLCASIVGSNPTTVFYFSVCLPHLAFAAADRALLRSSAETLAHRFFPPFLPPLLAIARMNRSTSALLNCGGASMASEATEDFRVLLTDAGSAVERCTISKAAWFTSLGCLGLRERFCILEVCHGRQPSQNESSPLPG